MSGSSVVDLRRIRESAVSGTAGWAGDGPAASDLFAEKGRAMACDGLQPAPVGGSEAAKSDAPPERPGRPARLTEAVIGTKRAAFVIGAGSGGSVPAATSLLALGADENAAPVLAFVDPQTAEEPAGEKPQAVPARRRIRTAMRLDAELCRRLRLVAGFTGRSTQAVIVTALQAYLRDMAPCSSAVPGKGPDGERSARASSPARGSRRSLRLHPHLYWRLAIAARKARRSMQSILTAALDSHLDTAAPDISAEVLSCLMGRTDEAGVSTSRSKSRPAHWRAQSGRPLGRRRLRNDGARGATPRLAGS